VQHFAAAAAFWAIAGVARCGAIQTACDAPTQPLEPGGVVQLAADVSAMMPSSLGPSSTNNAEGRGFDSDSDSDELRLESHRRAPCDAVISEVNKERQSTREPNVNVSRIAKVLGTTVAWAEHCMTAYGRRPPRPGVESSESKEAEIESFEEDEPEEMMPEDTEEDGAPDLKEHPERPKLLRVHPPPTPVEGREAEEGYGFK